MSHEEADKIDAAANANAKPDPSNPQFWAGLRIGQTLAARLARELADAIEADGMTAAAIPLRKLANSLSEEPRLN